MLNFQRLKYEAAGWKAPESGFKCRRGQEIFPFPKQQDRLWGPSSLLFIVYWGRFF